MNINFDPAKLKCDALVLGAGVSGLSTAIVLQSMGLKVSIVSETAPLKTANEALVSNVPTNYAMASAYPHFLRVDELLEISDITQTILKDLFKNTASGVTLHEIFEVYEYEPADAPLKDRRINFQTFEGQPSSLKRSINPPVRPGVDHLWGWVFDSYFCDLPVYIPYLWSIFEGNGGEFFRSKVTQKILQYINSEILIANCLGAGAIELFSDKTKSNIQRGCQILLKEAPPILNDRGIPKSFNYYPEKTNFPRSKNEAEYLHFFSRSDGWLLGQSREDGNFDKDGNWSGSKVIADHININETLIPKPILDLNLEIIRNWSAISIEPANLEARIGYRYYRDPDHRGVRLETDHAFGNRMVHNYAHGGSGVTMSWGCALKAAQLLLSQTKNPDFDKDTRKSLRQDLSTLRQAISTPS